MKISIIIPNYNGAFLLQQNIPSVINALNHYSSISGVKGEIIVVDDASNDESIVVLEKFKNVLDVIKNKENYGFAVSVNSGVKKSTGDIIVLLNSDVNPEKDFLLPLVKHFDSSKDLFAVGCLDRSVEGSQIVKRGRGVGKWMRGFLVHSAGSIEKNNTLWASGGSSAFRKDMWDKLGGFSTLYYPFYWEDIDLSYRAWKSGYTISFEKDSVVTHEHEKGAIKTKFSSFYIKTIAYKNQFIFVWTNITDIKLRISHIFWLPYYFIRSLIFLDFAFFTGFLYALLLIPKIIQFNIVYKTKQVKSDVDILSNFQS